MAKFGRNYLCPCRNDKKFRKYCALLASTGFPNPASPTWSFDDATLLQLTNRVIDLINEKLLDAAAAACERLRTEYAEQIDWLDRSACYTKHPMN